MSAIYCNLSTAAEVALTAATAKTILELTAASNHRIRVTGWGIFFDGTSATNEPVVVTLLRKSATITGTAATAKNKGVGTETVQTTGKYNASAEGTDGDIIDVIEVHPQGGYEKIIPMDQPILVPGGGIIAIKATAPAGVNCHAKIDFEE